MSATEQIPLTETTAETTCCYCGVGCGVTARVKNDRIIAVEGNSQHPANQGRLCVKGSALDETQAFSDRLLQPLVNGQTSDWETALTLAASQFKQIVDEHGPDSVAFYLSGQLLTEDYYIANKLMKGFIGTANVDTNSRLCMASAVVAHKRAFGEDLVPGCYEDLETTDLILLVGSNTAYTHPVTYQRIVQAKKDRPELKVVVLDPRRTPTCDIADIHLKLRPGADAFFFNGLLSYLASEGKLDQEFIQQHCEGFEEALQLAQAQVSSTAQSARFCDVAEADILRVYKLFAEKECVITLFSQGINQSSSGVDKGNSIINCHLATGKIGKPGSMPFSITGQPNAMGGREVGGLANQLAAHMNFGDDFGGKSAIDLVQRFWNAPNMATKEGLKAVDMFQAVHSGKIKAIWIMATNPVVSMPEADFVRQALRNCELVIVSDCVGHTDTAKEADIVFPATTWGEKNGTVTNSERCISLQKGIVSAPGEARNDWEIIAEFARKMGFEEGFNYSSAADIFREHASLSGFENHGERAFDISALADLSDEDYLNFKPTYWPIQKDPSDGTLKQTRQLFSNGHFYHKNGKARFIAVTASFPKKGPSDGKLVMNTGRIRDQWHTMGRTGSSVKLVNHTDEAYVEIHPLDAARHNLKQDDLAELSNLSSRFLGRVRVTDNVRPGEIFVPIHWNDRFASAARPGGLVTAITDPLCGQPEFKHTPVSVSAYRPVWHGLLLSTTEIKPGCEYWNQILISQGYKYRLADLERPQNLSEWIRGQFPQVNDWSELLDSESKTYRALGFIDGHMSVLLVLSEKPEFDLENNWIESQLGTKTEPSERFALLACATTDPAQDTGSIICSCYQVGEKSIISAIEQGLQSTEALGESLKCGTNCGSCIPELNELIAQNALAMEKAAAS